MKVNKMKDLIDLVDSDIIVTASLVELLERKLLVRVNKSEISEEMSCNLMESLLPYVRLAEKNNDDITLDARERFVPEGDEE